MEATGARSGDERVKPVKKNRRIRAVSSATGEVPGTRPSILGKLARDLTEAAGAGRLDPVIGRDAEIDELLDVLARRRGNNPILVGPPGVGKTAVVEGLARRLQAAGDGTRGLGDRTIMELSVGALISGTGVRGALAEKLAAVQAEVAASDGRILLFIDEIHALIGGQDGSDGVAGDLKAALARGELPCIGATTDAEYRKIFERDPALARRFTMIPIEEPKPEVAKQILVGIAPQYEKHHGVAYEEGVLDAALDMSVRYLTERQLPDKAIGLIDQAAARVRRRGGSSVALDDIAAVISAQVGVPVERLTMRDAERLLGLDVCLAQRVLGQPLAVERIAAALRRSAAGFFGSKPLGTFLFLGPTGVGKTEMAKAISEQLFPGNRLTRFDMSEFSEAHSVARLLGAPPGYIGHEHGGQLTEAVRLRPYQLVLMDEIEKAHPEVLLALLPLLDEGRLTDARGRTVNFSNCVVVMTSNLGGAVTPGGGKLGFGARSDSADAADGQERSALAAARAALPIELWNRIDEPLYFRTLDRATITSIARRMVIDIAALVRERYGVTLRVEDSAIDTLVAAGGVDAALGARPMKRTVSRLLEAPLAARLLEGQFDSASVAVVRGGSLELHIELLSQQPEAAE